MEAPNKILSIFNGFEIQLNNRNLEVKPHSVKGEFLPDLFVAVNLLRKVQYGDDHDVQFILGVLERLIAYFSCNNQDAIECSTEMVRDQFLVRFFTLIEKNLDNTNYSVNVICKELAISKTQLCRKVKDLTGRSIMENIRLLKLQKAATLLINTHYSVAEISYATGFEDPNYFCRVFSNYFGNSPTLFRKENKNGSKLKISGSFVQIPDFNTADLAATIGTAIS